MKRVNGGTGELLIFQTPRAPRSGASNLFPFPLASLVAYMLCPLTRKNGPFARQIAIEPTGL